uniref:Uncharacterized protein n=1 Tax=viral metagenome TaxID=1070528 RepID=A0A6H2A462_9ZZZZ
MKKGKCEKWFDAIAKYKKEEYRGKCETCLYAGHCEDEKERGRP